MSRWYKPNKWPSANAVAISTTVTMARTTQIAENMANLDDESSDLPRNVHSVPARVSEMNITSPARLWLCCETDG
ncbi:hypothetical protein D3C80_2135220 [compost metagenome]